MLADLFDAVAQPVAELLTPGAFLGGRRLMAVDGFEWDAPDTPANAEAFGYAGGSAHPLAFPKVRVVTLSECGSHAKTGAAIGPVTGAGSGERALARTLHPRLQEGELLLADRNFYSFTDWCQATDTGADLLWRISDTIGLPVLETSDDGSYLSVVFDAAVRGAARERLLHAARTHQVLPPGQARYVRVIEYDVPNRGEQATRELVCLLTTITGPGHATAPLLAQAYHQRWEHELANKEIKQVLRGPARVLRSKSPEMVRQEICGYLLAHYALSDLRCRAATEAGIDPDRIKFTRTVRIVRSVTDAAANNPRRERPATVAETHEPAQPLNGWPRSHASAELTGMDQLECVEATVHGVDHYLHATTARELHNDLGRVLDEYNEICHKHGAPEV